MAIIESTRPNRSELAGVSDFGPLEDEHDEAPGEQDPEPDREPEVEPDYANEVERLLAWIEDHNLARHFPKDELDRIGALCMREFDIDENSRAEWKEKAQKALKFATQDAEPKQYPWPKASNVIWPLITTAAIEFNARTYPALIQGRRVAKGVVWGSDDGTPVTQDGKAGGAPKVGEDGQPVWLVAPGAKQKRADRIGEHMSWQLLEQMDYWEQQTDSMTLQLPIVGGAVRKTYRDTVEGANESELVSLMNLVWNKHAKSFDRAPRHTEIITLYPDQLRAYENADETFLEIPYGTGDSGAEGEDTPDSSDTQAPLIFLEQHRRYDLDGDGYEEPIIVTVHKASQQVVRILARYEEDGIVHKNGKVRRIKPLEYYSLYGFLPDPEGGSYPVGFGHLLKPLNEAVNTTINQMFDAGHLQIAGGGFLGTSLSVTAGPMNFAIGEYKPVNTKGANIRDAVFPIPWPGPNAVLFQMLGFLVSEAKSLASTQNILSADAATLAKTAPTTMLAIIEQGMQVYTAIHKRVYRAMKSELAKLYRLNRLYLDKGDERFRVGDTWSDVTPEDYRLGGGVDPIADPTMVTDMQRLGRAAVLAEFKDDPLINPIELRKRILGAANIEGLDKLLPASPPPPSPQAQAELATQQAQLGSIRATEQKNLAQGVLFMAQAREHASGPQLQWLENQIQVMRLRIEALNTQVKAAAVDANVHGHNTRLQAVKEKARQAANEQPTSELPEEQPEPGPPSGPQGGGLGPVAPPSGDNGAPPISGGLPGGPAGGGPGAMGGGNAGPLG